MPLATLNGSPVISLELHRPRIGRWHAELEIADAALPTGKVATLVVGDLSFVGYVAWGDAFVGKTRMRVNGGTGGLDQVVAPRFYSDAPARIPIADLIDALGEKLATSSDSALLATKLSKWTRFGGIALDELGTLVDHLGAIWRVLPDGTALVAATETWPAVAPDAVLVDHDTVRRILRIANDDASIAGGVTFAGFRISRSILRVAASSFETEAWIET